MRFFTASAALATVSAELTVHELFVAKPASTDANQQLVQLKESAEDYESQLAFLNACDPDSQADCNIYGLVQLDIDDEDSTAIVNMGLWNDLKNGLSDLKKIAGPEVRYMAKHAEKLVEKALPVVEKMTQNVEKKIE